MEYIYIYILCGYMYIIYIYGPGQQPTPQVMVMVLYVRCMYAVCRKLYERYSLHTHPPCGMGGG